MIPPSWVDPLRRPRRPVQHVIADIAAGTVSWTGESAGVLDELMAGLLLGRT